LFFQFTSEVAERINVQEGEYAFIRELIRDDKIIP